MRPVRTDHAWMLCLAVVVFAFSGCQSLHDQFREPPRQEQTAPAPSEAVRSVHLPFGNPSNATADPGNEDNLLIVGEGSVISYSNARGTPNWVAWRTTGADLGDSIRRPDFRPDPRLPKWYKRIGHFDYSGTGYDRGHMVPSADRFGDPRLNAETFLMTNIVPQSPSLNQYPWNDFEQYVRAQVRRGFDAYQIAGCYGERERLKGKITAPASCWKVAALLRRGTETAAIDDRARVVAVEIPNEDGLDNETWPRFRTTVRAIEQRTGLNLFSTLPADLQQKLETRTETISR